MQTCEIKLTKATEKYGNLNIRPCGKAFFPEDVFGSHSREAGIGTQITLKAEGLVQPIKTDIPTDKDTGRPRWLFRDRAWVKSFLQSNKLKAGDSVLIRRDGQRRYSLVANGHMLSSERLTAEIERCGLAKVSNDKAVRQTKTAWLQRTLVPIVGRGNVSEYGTFRDSLNAPVHRWFKYPAGYSYRLVEEKIRQYALKKGDWIFDPFVGSGTTCVEAKRHGINSIGVEAHPFVCWVAKTKLNWSCDVTSIAQTFRKVEKRAENLVSKKKVDTDRLPDLLKKCYSQINLLKLVAIREAILRESVSGEIRDFLNLALTDTLRNASRAATGWPYIAPAKMHQKVVEKPAGDEFRIQVRRMLDDRIFMQKQYSREQGDAYVILGDARAPHSEVAKKSVKLAVTSPPYLNNYDYADRTRLETYFFEWFSTWGEISKNVRDKLITSATTQIRRNSFGEHGGLSENVKAANPSLFKELVEKVSQLTERRNEKGGKKSYDCMVAGYFNDMTEVLKQTCACLETGSDFVLVLGDSAPYGVYIPTHEYLARLGRGVGFSSDRVEHLRTRGDKWRANPQRHKVKLREVILTLTK
ncbi:MAG: hypothetical protein KAY65_14705 [Planctomycetes bacterium]|nr:hypothetical protein [Planctomycetota bacterium]